MDVSMDGIVRRDSILFETSATMRDEVIGLLVENLLSRDACFDPSATILALREREEVLPTVIAPGLAIPHARLKGMNKTLVAIATSSRGIEFDPLNQPANIVVLILTPKDDPSSYLRVLSLILGMLKDVDIPQYIKSVSADDIYSLFNAVNGQTKVILTAADVMNCRPATLLESDSLDIAIKVLCSRQTLDIPVIDDVGDLRGQVEIEDLLRLSLPYHLLWVEDLKPIINFEPFSDMLKKDINTKVADFMHEECLTVPPDMPAVQLAKMFLSKGIRQIHVVDGHRLLGTVDLASFCTKLLWA